MSHKLSYVYAALLDVLGYRYRLDKDSKSGTLAFFDQLQNAMRALTSVNEADYAYKAISDTVILTCAKREELVSFLRVVKDVFLAFLQEGLLVRGGITYSQHFTSGNVTYSHAIARAYELESSQALYPRIVIDHNILEMFQGAKEAQELVRTQLICVFNDIYFLNVLDAENWRTTYDYAKTLYEHDRKALFRKESEFSKHVWFENYLFASPFRDDTCPRYIPPMTLLTTE